MPREYRIFHCVESPPRRLDRFIEITMSSFHPSTLCCGKRRTVTACLTLVLFAFMGSGGEAFARPPSFDGFSGRADEQQGAGRKYDLRQSLSPQGDHAERSSVRRKLSIEERDALRRDLRAATRGAYRDEPGSRRRD